MVVAMMALAFADYLAPPPQAAMAQATGVIVASVTGRDAEGHLTLEVHEVIAGEAASELTGTTHSCFRQVPALDIGKRYLLLVDEDRLFEETTYFDVRSDGTVQFWSANDDLYTRAWMPMDAVRARVSAARAAVPR